MPLAFISGEGGTSKTFTVNQTLESVGTRFKVTNTRLTGKGLFELLDNYPDIIHVLDDVETLFSDKHAYGVLRAALWGQGQEPRTITWHTGPEGRREVVFTGGIILIANSPMENHPALRALKTRITSVKFAPTNEELAALMRSIASKGFEHAGRKLSPESCLEVAEEILKRSVRLQRNLDLRLLVNTLRDRVQFEDGKAEVHWTDHLECRIQERVLTPQQPLLKLRNEGEVLREIANLPRGQRLQQWKAETGLSQATLYRRLSEYPHQN